MTSTAASAEAVEVLGQLAWHSCHSDRCYRIEARSAARSALARRYTLENIVVTVFKRANSKVVRTFRAQSALTSLDWNDWLFDLNGRESVSFDAPTGRFYGDCARAWCG